MTLIRYIEANAPGGTRPSVDWSGGTFNVRDALRSGSGAFTVDDSTQAALVAALDAFPGVQRAGGAGSVGGGTDPGIGVELGAAQVTSNPANITATSFVAIAGLSATVVTGVRPVRVEAFVPVINGLTTLAAVIVGIFRDGTQIGGVTIPLPAGLQFLGWPAIPVARDNPSPGTHIYDVRAKIGTSGQIVSPQGSASSPLLLQVVGV